MRLLILKAPDHTSRNIHCRSSKILHHLDGCPPSDSLRSHFSSASFSILPSTAPSCGLEKTVMNTCAFGGVCNHMRRRVCSSVLDACCTALQLIHLTAAISLA